MHRNSIFLFLVTAGLAWGMDLSQPLDPVYSDLRNWSLRGILAPLPALRPYPLILVKKYLEEVIQKGSSRDVQRAQMYLMTIGDTAAPLAPGFTITHSSLFAVGFPNHDYDGTSSGYLTLNQLIAPGVGINGHAGAVAVDWAANTTFPLGQRRLYDFLLDDSSIKVFGRTYLLSLSMRGNVSFGDENLYAQVGVTRHGFGPFIEGMVFSPQAPAAPSFSFTWRTEGLNYTKYLLILNATKDTKSTVITNGQEFFPNKYLAGQSFQFFFFDQHLEIGLYENIVFGQRLEPAYLVPVMSLLYGSIYNGMVDNILVGANFQLRLPLGFNFMGEFHADDLSFLKIFSLKFDGKTKIAAQAGIAWYPEWGAFQGLELRYGLVTPYTFTHVREFVTGGPSNQLLINYKNYTHSGQGLVNLEPNSDRWELRFRIVPNQLLNFSITGRYLRHGNASDDGYLASSHEFIGTTDGSFNDNGYVAPGGNHKFNSNRFLTQSVIETLWQIGFDYQLLLASPLGFVTFAGGYMFEYGLNRRGDPFSGTLGSASFQNRGVPLADNNGVRHYVSLRVGFEL